MADCQTSNNQETLRPYCSNSTSPSRYTLPILSEPTFPFHLPRFAKIFFYVPPTNVARAIPSVLPEPTLGPVAPLPARPRCFSIKVWDFAQFRRLYATFNILHSPAPSFFPTHQKKTHFAKSFFASPGTDSPPTPRRTILREIFFR